MINANVPNYLDDGDEPGGKFEIIANDLLQKGCSVIFDILPELLVEQLCQHVVAMPHEKFNIAGVGRENDHAIDHTVRSDQICWITGESEVGRQWLSWAVQLQNYLNRRLFLGLFSFESHFALYRPGDFYKKHVDAFKGQANRVLSLVLYLNSGWCSEHGGELKIYLNEEKGQSIEIVPRKGTLVVFLSEDFPHEVLPALRDRYSIAGWFRVNGSSKEKADPPL